MDIISITFPINTPATLPIYAHFLKASTTMEAQFKFGRHRKGFGTEQLMLLQIRHDSLARQVGGGGCRGGSGHVV